MNALLKFIAWSYYTKPGAFSACCMAALTWATLEFTGHYVAAVIIGPVLIGLTFLRAAYLGDPEGFKRSFGITETPDDITDKKEASDHE